jgi:PAS domain S-box-containing protein
MKINISSMLIITFVAVALMVTSIGGYAMYLQSEKVITSEIYAHLDTATKSKSEHIKTYLNDAKKEAEVMSNSIVIATFLESEKNDTDYQSKMASAQKRVDQVLATEPGYDEVFVIGNNSQVVLTTSKAHLGLDRSADTFFTEGRKKLFLKDPYISDVTGKPQIGVAVPIFGSSGALIGVYAVRINMDELNSIATDRTGLGESGEFVVIDKDSSVVTPLKYKENAVLKTKIETELSRTCLKDMGEYRNASPNEIEPHNETVMVYKDYRGVPSIGTHSYVLPQAEWCVIAKMDEAEALGKPLGQLLGSFILISLALILTMSLAIYLISGRVSQSISMLAEDVDKITKGSLDIQLRQSSISEVQSLTNSLNRVLASLKLAVLRSGLSKKEMGLSEALFAKKEAEDKYKVLYENSSDAIMILEPPDWKFTSGNAAAIKMFRVKDEKEFTSLGPGDLSPKYQPEGELSSENAKKMIMKAMKEGSVFFEWTHKRYKGQDFPASVLLTKAIISGKDVVQATVRDLTDEKKTASDAANAKELRQLALDSLPDSFFICDLAGKFLSWNKAFQESTGYSGEEIEKMKTKDILAAKDLARMNAAIKKSMKKGPTKVKAVVVTKGKQHLLTEFSGAVLKDSNGKVIGFTGIGRRLAQSD